MVFDTAYTYDVTAGTGPFNASYVDSFFTDLAALEKNYTYAVLPYSYYGPANDLITNPFYTTTTTPLGCEVAAAERDSAADCAAYLVSGGVVGLAPWVPAGYPDHQQVLVNNVPTIHVEFAAMPAGRTFANESCRVYGSNTTRIAAKLCLSQPEPTKLDAGMFLFSFLLFCFSVVIFFFSPEKKKECVLFYLLMLLFPFIFSSSFFFRFPVLSLSSFFSIFSTRRTAAPPYHTFTYLTLPHLT